MERVQRLTVRAAVCLAAPHTWVASLYPALFGLLVSRLYGGGVRLSQAVLLVAACILMQSAINTLNDYADYVKGSDSVHDNVEEQDAVLLYSNIPPIHAFILGLCYLVAALALGFLCCAKTGHVPLCIGAIGGVVVLLYSGGRMPLSYLPVGEVVSGFVMGGLIPLAIAAVPGNALHVSVLVYALPLMVGIALIMLTNNGCDIEKDMRAGRHTLPVYMGRIRTVQLYRVLVIVWVALVGIGPVAVFGVRGILVPLCMLLCGRSVIAALLSSRLLPEERIRCMKDVVKANVAANGIYIAAFSIGLVEKALRG